VQSRAVSAARSAAFDILERVEEGAFASILLARGIEELQLSDRRLTQELVLGVLRWELFLDALISHYARRDVASLDRPVLLALRLGLYQLRFLTRVPQSAAVNESVKLVRRARLRSAEPLVNAVLRRATREADYDPTSAVSDPLERLSLQTSHPAWLLERWVRSFGFELASQFAEANNLPPSPAFRIVNNVASLSSVQDELRAAGCTVRPSAIAGSAWVLEGSTSALMALASAGKVYIQDEASQLVSEIVNARESQVVLDLCAAPGSKATHIADLSSKTTVIASDFSEPRLRTVMQTANLHKLGRIHCLVLDALEPLPFPENSFDVVLVDAPCSGTGTLRRNPEIRWRITAADIEELSSRQRQILDCSADVIKPGGRLIYSTCSVEPEENEQVIQPFMAVRKDFEAAEITLNPKLNVESHVIRTWPHRDVTDGFFVAQMRRRTS